MRLPAVPPAVGVALGVELAHRLTHLPVPLAAALLAAGIALRGATGGLALGIGAGLLAAVGAVSPVGPWMAVDPARPVAVVGKVAEHPRRIGWAWRSELEVERLVQGELLVTGRHRLRLELPAAEEPPVFGSRLAVRGYLGRPSGFFNRIPVPPGPWRLRVKSARLVEVIAPPGPLARLAAAARHRVEEACRGAEVGASAGEAATQPGGSGSGGPAERGRRPRHPPDSPLAGRTSPRLGRSPRADAADDGTSADGSGSGAGPALVRALVLGDPSHLPDRWRRGLRRTGLAHLLAVSGLHVGLVAGLALLVALPLPPRARLAVAALAVAGYVLVAGGRPALLRAAGMGLAAGLARWVGRAPAAANALALVVAGLELVRPELGRDLGFGLTVAATGGIVLLAPALATAWSGSSPGRVRHRLAVALAASIGAQLVSAPLALPAFHLLSPVSPLVNLVAVPWTAVALAGCLGWTALAIVWPAAGAAAAPALDLLAAPFGWPAAGPPEVWGVVPVAAPALVTALAATALAAALLRPRRLWPAVVAALALWPAVRWGSALPPGTHGVELAMLDVGQGDAVLLRDGPSAVLVDGGGWPGGDFGGRVLVPALLGEGVPRLAAAVLTHADTDHCAGLVDAASYLPIDEVWMAAGEETSGCGAALAATPGARLRLLRAGDRMVVGRWRFRVLHPEGMAAAESPRAASNARSLVLVAVSGSRRCLLTGDVEAPTERRLSGVLAEACAPEVEPARPVSSARIAGGRRHADGGRVPAAGRRDPAPPGRAAGRSPGCEVLKVAHHGSKTSTTRPFLAAAAPRLALVSAGRGNRYGHPAREVVERLDRAGVFVLRTDLDGAIHLLWRPGGRLGLQTLLPRASDRRER